jgi:outer membrane autotransporter protein
VNLTLARNFRLGEVQSLQPYVRFGYDEQDTSGGALRFAREASPFYPNTDSGHTFVGVGVAWQINATQQAHFDYESSWGSRYDIPWAINAGWRLRF